MIEDDDEVKDLLKRLVEDVEVLKKAEKQGLRARALHACPVKSCAQVFESQEELFSHMYEEHREWVVLRDPLAVVEELDLKPKLPGFGLPNINLFNVGIVVVVVLLLLVGLLAVIW